MMPEEKKTRRQRAAHGDRIQLSEETLKILSAYDEQLFSAFGNTVAVTHRDKVQFLISERNPQLNQSELSKLRDRHFNEVKALKLAIAEVKLAKNEGRSISMDEILKKITAPQVIEKVRAKRARAPRSEPSSNPDTIDLKDRD